MRRRAESPLDDDIGLLCETQEHLARTGPFQIEGDRLGTPHRPIGASGALTSGFITAGYRWGHNHNLAVRMSG